MGYWEFKGREGHSGPDCPKPFVGAWRPHIRLGYQNQIFPAFRNREGTVIRRGEASQVLTRNRSRPSSSLPDNTTHRMGRVNIGGWGVLMVFLIFNKIRLLKSSVYSQYLEPLLVSVFSFPTDERDFIRWKGLWDLINIFYFTIYHSFKYFEFKRIQNL